MSPVCRGSYDLVQTSQTDSPLARTRRGLINAAPTSIRRGSGQQQTFRRPSGAVTAPLGFWAIETVAITFSPGSPTSSRRRVVAYAMPSGVPEGSFATEPTRTVPTIRSLRVTAAVVAEDPGAYGRCHLAPQLGRRTRLKTRPRWSCAGPHAQTRRDPINEHLFAPLGLATRHQCLQLACRHLARLAYGDPDGGHRGHRDGSDQVIAAND